MLTVAISKDPEAIDIAYDIPQIFNYADYVSILSYNYHTYTDGKTGHNAPLDKKPDENGLKKTRNVKHTLQHLLEKGAIPGKTVLGIPLFGRSFSLINESNNGIGADARSDQPCRVCFSTVN